MSKSDNNDSEVEDNDIQFEEMGAQFEEDVVEYGTVFLDIYTPTVEKAQELALGPDNYNFEVDRQTDDHDYTGDRRNQEITDLQTNKHELTPQMFGF